MGILEQIIALNTPTSSNNPLAVPLILDRNSNTQSFPTNTHYLQIAFNYDLSMVRSLLPKIRYDDRILIEAGTPFIKREGMRGIATIASMWPGKIVADMKTLDGAEAEVDMVAQAGATAVTVAGNAPAETLNIFIDACKRYNVASIIDLIGVSEPLDVMRALIIPPKIVVLHVGRDEETSRGKVIQYRHVKRIKSKYDVLITSAGGVTVDSARSATFNGSNIVVANIVTSADPWSGISSDEDISNLVEQFLTTIA